MNNSNTSTAKSGIHNQNSMKLIGTIFSEVNFSHEVVRKNDNSKLTFWRFTLEVQRLSGVSDFLEVIISGETWFEFFNRWKNTYDENSPKAVVEISGRLQSHNQVDPETEKNKLDLFILAKSIRLLTTPKENDIDNGTEVKPNYAESLNTVSIEGFVCKEPILRKTSIGRTIADVFVAVNRRRGSAYIPIILWGGSAVNAKDFKIGDKAQLTGRFQSREYTKMENGIRVTHLAYEMSASRLSYWKNI